MCCTPYQATFMYHSLGSLLILASVRSLRTSKRHSSHLFRNFVTMADNRSIDSLVGKTIPGEVLDETLLTDKKDQTSLRSILSALPEGYKGIVLFLFPAVGTPYCTKQACKFSSSTGEFKNLGYEVFGVTRGSATSAGDWTKQHGLNYTILIDKNWTLIQYLRCTWMHFLVNRSHVIIGRDAKILAIERGVNAEASSDIALKLAKGLHRN